MVADVNVKNLLGEVRQVLDIQKAGQKRRMASLLAEVRLMLDSQKKEERQRGEKFNVFYILGMESKEDKTHSAFIGELLNPDGSHLRGDIFLKIFLDTVGVRKEELNTKSAWVNLEEYIGSVDLSKKVGERTGGRIDIYIADENGNSVSIENKIYARDQEAQIERYCNHNKQKNKVYYLTLRGDDPSEYSKGDLEEEKDYSNISYREHIRRWLELCLKESVDQPILHETIKQYFVLIKRLTNIMNDEHQKHLFDLISKNLEAAEHIRDSLLQFKQKIHRNIHEKIFRHIERKMEKSGYMDGYILKKYDPINYYAPITIIAKDYEEDTDLHFRIGTFHEKNREGLFVSIYDKKGNSEYALSDKDREDKQWLYTLYLKPYEEHDANMSNAKTLLRLYNDESFSEAFVKNIFEQIEQHVNEHTARLSEYLKSQT